MAERGTGGDVPISEADPAPSGPPASLPYDAVLVVSFGGPERLEDVMPFLQNVARGKKVPEGRLEELAERYRLFNGVSPIGAESRALVAALAAELHAHGLRLGVYWGNRYWHPLLQDTLAQMAEDGVRRALAFVTSAFGSYPGCRQYQEEIEQARQAVGPTAPVVEKLRLFFNHPGFVEAMGQRVAVALEQIPPERRAAARLIYTAHSLPLAMARRAPYVEQLTEACRLVSACVGRAQWELTYQSRSGPPDQPWLEPDVGDRLVTLARTERVRDVVIAPIGFVLEHMEVVYDLDVELGSLCEELGITMVRSGVVGADPRLVTMIRQLIQERLDPEAPRLALGRLGPSPDSCPAGCCLP